MRTLASLFAFALLAAPAVAVAQPARPPAQGRAVGPRRAPPRAPAAATTPAATPAATPEAPPPRAPTDAIEPEGFALRPIDRATVRLIAIQGIGGRVLRARSGTNRLVAAVDASHGSGVVVHRDGIVLTARHVVQGVDALAVVFPGQRTAVPATVVYSDPDHDVAFVRIQTTRPLTSVVPLPETAPTLSSGQRVSITGYPLDPRERYPAAATGDLARVNNDGRIQLSIAANPGNSGGPVVDSEGHLIGVVSERGSPQEGVEGVTLVEPIRDAVEAWRRDGRTLASPTFSPEDARLAQSMFDLLRLDPDRDEHDPASTERVLALSTAALIPEAACVVAAQAWNEAIFALERNHAVDIAALPADRRPEVEALVREARTLHHGALTAAPYLRAHYDFSHLLERIDGAVVAPELAPRREGQP